MKKKFLILLLAIFILLPVSVFARVDAVDINDGGGAGTKENYALCVYEFYNNPAKEYKIRIELIYDSNSTVIEHNSSAEKLNSTANYGIKINVSGDVYIEDFYKSGKLGCPDIGYSSVANTDPNFRGQIWSISKNYTTQLVATSESVIIENSSSTGTGNGESDTNSEDDMVIACDYDSFRIGLINGTPKIVLKTSSSKEVYENLEAEKFKDNNCPTVYTCTHGTVDYITYKTTYSYADANYCVAHEATVIDMEDGEEIKDFEVGDVGLEPSTQECASLLGDPDDSDAKEPAFYLQKIFDIMKYTAIIVIVVFSILDFAGAVMSQDDNAIKKAVSKLVVRMILCIVIFILPIVLKFIFELIDIYSPSTCGID